eukprot:GHVU01072913.1.p1 GENE.GHVU01072913.1~~GHVU01072913.1.p1  ORF type:complete len:103 (+),score=8.35 GHVU01072913.1:221-529(+)
MNQHSVIEETPEINLPEISNEKAWYNFVRKLFKKKTFIQRMRNYLGEEREISTAAADGLKSGHCVFMRVPDKWVRLRRGDQIIDKIPPKLEFLVLFEDVSQS